MAAENTVLYKNGVEILRGDKTANYPELEDIKKGDLSAEDLAASIRSIKDSLICLNDSQAALDNWYSMRLGDTPVSPEEFIAAVEAVTLEEVIKASKTYVLDTVYKIMPKEKGEN